MKLMAMGLVPDRPIEGKSQKRLKGNLGSEKLEFF